MFKSNKNNHPHIFVKKQLKLFCCKAIKEFIFTYINKLREKENFVAQTSPCFKLNLPLLSFQLKGSYGCLTKRAVTKI